MRFLVTLIVTLALSLAACQPAEAGWFLGKRLIRGARGVGRFVNNHRPRLLRRAFGGGCANGSCGGF